MMAFNKQKAFGQNFLINQSVIQTIVHETEKKISENPIQTLIEIGPGRGALTEALLSTLDFNELELYLIEKDFDLIEFWKNKLASSQAIKILGEDFLKINYEEFFIKNKYGVVSNLPYSAGTAILVFLNKIAVLTNKIDFMILMFQKEVADKVFAKIPGKNASSLGVMIQNNWEIKKVIDVPPSAFKPMPKVNSSVLCFKKRDQPLINGFEQSEAGLKKIEKLLKDLFLHRRKMLKSSFKNSKNHLDLLEFAQVSGEKRAQDLNWSEWSSLYENMD